MKILLVGIDNSEFNISNHTVNPIIFKGDNMPSTGAGHVFEEYVYEKLIIPEGWINLTPYELKSKPSRNGQIYTHKEFPTQFEKYFNFNTKTVWSKNIKPDFVFYNPELKKVVALEVKKQEQSGSVDEKLQTGGKKLKRLRKLFNIALQIPYENISYSYLLKREDFDKKEYQDTFDDILEDGCKYYFVDENFSFEIQ